MIGLDAFIRTIVLELGQRVIDLFINFLLSLFGVS
jgi:hypothetical protein